jgi:hypothetical protein
VGFIGKSWRLIVISLLHESSELDPESCFGDIIVDFAGP